MAKGSAVQKGSLAKLLFDGRDAGKLSFTSGEFSDRFIPPNKILRSGTFDVEGNEEFEGLEYEATITLGRLIPKKKSAA